MKITYLQDPGHGWLAVPLSLISEWGITPSSYSYRDESTGYLEEDCDARLFMDAATARGVLVELSVSHSNADSFVRNLPRFKGAA